MCRYSTGNRGSPVVWAPTVFRGQAERGSPSTRFLDIIVLGDTLACRLLLLRHEVIILECLL